MRGLKQSVLRGMRLSLNAVGLRRKKVFAIGFNKTGTSSLHALFESLGLPSYHGVRWRGCDDVRLLRLYECFSDGIPLDFAKLDRVFPRSKFILQVRDLDSWIYSRLAHIERQKVRKVHRATPLWDNTEYSVKHWIRQRNAHHASVVSYFAGRPSDLLIVNFIRDASAATKICRFLGYEGTRDRPRKNVNPAREYPENHVAMLMSCIGELGIPRSELGYDILCPSLLSDEMRDTLPVDTGMPARGK
jgi:hypothetical protein